MWRSSSRRAKPSTCAIALRRHVGQDQRLVVVLARALDDLDERRGRVLAELRVDGPERRVRVDHDLVGRERDQRAAAHRVVRHDGRHLGRRGRRARRRSGVAASTSPPGVWRTISIGRSGGRLADRPQDALARRRCRCSATSGKPSSDIVSWRWISVITVALRLRERAARLWRRRAAAALALDGRLERGQDEEQPEEAERVYGEPSSAASGLVSDRARVGRLADRFAPTRALRRGRPPPSRRRRRTRRVPGSRSWPRRGRRRTRTRWTGRSTRRRRRSTRRARGRGTRSRSPPSGSSSTLKSTTCSRTRRSGARSQRPWAHTTASAVPAIDAAHMSASRHQPIASERRQTSELTTL